MNKKLYILVIISSVLIAACAIIFGVFTYSGTKKYANEKTITLQDTTEKRTEINLEGFCPGDRKSYTFNCKANRGECFDVTLSFESTGEDSLSRFIDVEVWVDGEKRDRARLNEYFDGRELPFKADFSDKNQVKIEIFYIMELNVGDEAQNTAADFDVVLLTQQ